MSSSNLDATKHDWIDELVPYTFSLEYQKGKNNVVDALSRIGAKWLPQEETDEILKATPLLKGDPTVVEKKGIPWAQQLEKLKADLGPLKN